MDIEMMNNHYINKMQKDLDFESKNKLNWLEQQYSIKHTEIKKVETDIQILSMKLQNLVKELDVVREYEKDFVDEIIKKYGSNYKVDMLTKKLYKDETGDKIINIP